MDNEEKEVDEVFSLSRSVEELSIDKNATYMKRVHVKEAEGDTFGRQAEDSERQ